MLPSYIQTGVQWRRAITTTDSIEISIENSHTNTQSTGTHGCSTCPTICLWIIPSTNKQTLKLTPSFTTLLPLLLLSVFVSLSISTAIFQVNLGWLVFTGATNNGSGGDNWS